MAFTRSEQARNQDGTPVVYEHDSDDAPKYDEERQRFIEAHGIQFARLTNADVQEN